MPLATPSETAHLFLLVNFGRADYGPIEVNRGTKCGSCRHLEDLADGARRLERRR